ncbi:hypothetical protein GJW-30_1_03030 [Variibacter gotjawalensis]|uniref:Uncharacterized protein n=1 Tax=Variibacter gotjawalensis TaxID=1333996 RepID=A0A0S3PX32_9BRAD|nr:hypothetical protein [Variibacter gotjawalensis]NIK46315.1 hypothetical protein [Variibacter gotjawalensis]RZS48229.1 hypothetical protein EV661_0633 [Variibacter gotjawalensis]BAT60486.1 hypothetical protein GJW-30_1_03030 [Variibacter gotjawalensis]
MAEDPYEKAQRMLQIADMMSNPKDAKKMRAAAETLLFGSSMTKFVHQEQVLPEKVSLRRVAKLS